MSGFEPRVSVSAPVVRRPAVDPESRRCGWAARRLTEEVRSQLGDVQHVILEKLACSAGDHAAITLPLILSVATKEMVRVVRRVAEFAKQARAINDHDARQHLGFLVVMDPTVHVGPKHGGNVVPENACALGPTRGLPTPVVSAYVENFNDALPGSSEGLIEKTIGGLQQGSESPREACWVRCSPYTG